MVRVVSKHKIRQTDDLNGCNYYTCACGLYTKDKDFIDKHIETENAKFKSYCRVNLAKDPDYYKRRKKKVVVVNG